MTTDTARTPPRGVEQRFLARRRLRRWRRWRGRVLTFLGLLLLTFAAWILVLSPWLTLTHVEVRGLRSDSMVTEQQIVETAALHLDAPLLRQPLGEADQALTALDAVADAALSRKWPHTVVVTITPRVPVAAITIGSTIKALDAEGHVFGEYDAVPEQLPRVDSPQDTSADALREAALVASGLPEWLHQITASIHVETIDQITLQLRDGRVVSWGSSADAELKNQVISALMQAAPTAHLYDVSVPGQPVYQ